jgi:hypothetical protein
LGKQLVKCWSFNTEEPPSLLVLLKTIKELFVYKDQLQAMVCHRWYVPNLVQSNGNSRDTWKTLGITISSTTRSQATTIPCPPRSPTSVSLPLPPEVSPGQCIWRNPCCDVEDNGSTLSAPALTSQNYLRLLSNNSESNGYVTPRTDSIIHCGCQALASQYQNLTDHVCPSSTTSSAA